MEVPRLRRDCTEHRHINTCLGNSHGSGEKRREKKSMEYIILSLILLAIGIYGLVMKRNLLKILMSIEIIAAAASMNFVIFGSMAGDQLGQVFFILALSVDTVITAVVIALVLIAYREYGILDVWDLSKLKES
ncbi:NADH-quinone oxidoreductase subunit NuoK [Candidatus Bathyarchaeota archaeon]|nr:MAG: NADH-quinone oxidoreductase subunit NuoK [Candidatus Bathyarchaeota archaeon]